jgi:hypothetical protein
VIRGLFSSWIRESSLQSFFRIQVGGVVVARIVQVAVLVFIVGLVLTKCTGGPLDTRLPLDLSELPKLQPQLDKLPPEERALVVAYLERSRGDVLPAHLADPDEPLTARTFREAIKLQRAYDLKMAPVIAQREAARAQREAALAPMRKALGVDVIKRELNPGLVLTFRVHNRSDETVTSFSGTAKAKGGAMQLTCRLAHQGPITIGQTAELRCMSSRMAKDAEARFAALADSEVEVTWDPVQVSFGSGTVLKAD